MKSTKNKANQSTDAKFDEIMKALLGSPPQHKKKTKKKVRKLPKK